MKKYLEYKNEKKHKFWKIDVEGSTHTVRYGDMYTYGQEKTKTFDSEEKALKNAEKLIASKEKKGYKEVEEPKPILLEDHLNKEQKNKFKNLNIKDLKEDECRFWHLEMQKLLRETVYSGSYRMDFVSAKGWGKIFEKIALWDSPNMEKEIIRNKDNYIEKINYSINSKVILSLSASGLHHITTFFAKENVDNINY